MRFQSYNVVALQEASEAYLVKIFLDKNGLEKGLGYVCLDDEAKVLIQHLCIYSFENVAEKMSLGDEDETVGETAVESDEDEDTFDVLTEETALIESKKFVDRVEWLLDDVNEQCS